jgi:hypothetical protein
MGEAVDVSGSEEEAAAQLEGVRSELTLMMTSGASEIKTSGIVAAKDVEQVRGTQIRYAIGLALRVDQQRKRDFGFFAEAAGVVEIAEADDGEGCALIAKCLFEGAQLRDVLAAENSSIVTQKTITTGFRSQSEPRRTSRSSVSGRTTGAS